MILDGDSPTDNPVKIATDLSMEARMNSPHQGPPGNFDLGLVHVQLEPGVSITPAPIARSYPKAGDNGLWVFTGNAGFLTRDAMGKKPRMRRSKSFKFTGKHSGSEKYPKLRMESPALGTAEHPYYVYGNSGSPVFAYECDKLVTVSHRRIFFSKLSPKYEVDPLLAL